MAVAVGVFVEIVLMILFCLIEVLERQKLHDKPLGAFFLFLLIDAADYGHVVGVGVVDACAVLCASVVALLV